MTQSPGVVCVMLSSARNLEAEKQYVQGRYVKTDAKIRANPRDQAALSEMKEIIARLSDIASSETLTVWQMARKIVECSDVITLDRRVKSLLGYTYEAFILPLSVENDTHGRKIRRILRSVVRTRNEVMAHPEIALTDTTVWQFANMCSNASDFDKMDESEVQRMMDLAGSMEGRWKACQQMLKDCVKLYQLLVELAGLWEEVKANIFRL